MGLNIRNFQIKTRIVFGKGSLSKVGDLARELKATRCLLVVDSAMAQNGVVDIIADNLRNYGLECRGFQNIEPEPYLDNAEGAARLGRDFKADLVIGVGGGPLWTRPKLHLY